MGGLCRPCALYAITLSPCNAPAGIPDTSAISGSAGLETRTGMRAVAKRFAGRMPTTAQGATHFYAFLPELVVQFHASAKRDRTVLDT